MGSGPVTLATVMDSLARARSAGIAAFLLAVLSGCGSLGAVDEPRPLRTPELQFEAHPHAGTSLTGPLPLVGEVAEGRPLVVDVTALWVERTVATSDDLAARAGLVLGPGDADPLRAIARRAGEVGFQSGAASSTALRAIADGAHGRTSAAWTERVPLAPGTTYRVRADGSNAPGTTSFLLDATRASDATEARIALQLGLRGDDTREKILLSTPLAASNGPFLFVFPLAAQRDEPAALVVSVEVREESIDSVPRESLASAAVAAADRRREITRSEEEAREIDSLLVALDRPAERRARLAHLAGTCGAPLALDVALVANDADLADFAIAVRASLPAPVDRKAAAWPIERATWLFVGSRAASGNVAPELAGVLARQGGEAARFPGAIEDLVRCVDGVDAFAARLVAENKILLEDGSPASRSRAFDWLTARGVAPAGFDPFGTLAERRAALQRAEELEASKDPVPAVPR